MFLILAAALVLQEPPQTESFGLFDQWDSQGLPIYDTFSDGSFWLEVNWPTLTQGQIVHWRIEVYEELPFNGSPMDPKPADSCIYQGSGTSVGTNSNTGKAQLYVQLTGLQFKYENKYHVSLTSTTTYYNGQYYYQWVSRHGDFRIHTR